jgi:predicted ATPase/DNA-binding winged helix-turn-helix (wHTH) protein
MTGAIPPPAQPGIITFGAFRIDVRAGRLWRAGDAIPVRPKTWSVLLYLVQRPGVLVGREELLDAVWPDVAVTPDTLTKSIGELRQVLGDDVKTPRYIETAHRRGFRFIASVSLDSAVEAVSPSVAGGGQVRSAPVVGRAPEIQRLQQLLTDTRAGQRQLVLVTGAAGIGKTTLLDAFLDSPWVQSVPSLWVGRGVCVEQHGTREAYLPALDALSRLARRPDAAPLTALLPRIAPTWLAQMPWLIGDGADHLRRSIATVGPERMLREFAALIEALTSEVTIVLVLEDLHWSDPSTVDLLCFLAQRRDPARLLVIGSYRPADLVVHEHPLAQTVHTLKGRRQAVELPLHELTEHQVRGYLQQRFANASFPVALAPALHQHTDGNPLFVVAVVDHMLARGTILDTAPGWALSVPVERLTLGVPDDVGHMIEAQIDALSPADRELLDAASVSGVEFAVPAIAALLASDPATIEMRCERLARARRLLRAAGTSEWPDGSVTRRYRFTHELYRQVVYAAIPDRRRSRMHRALAETMESSYADRAAEIASILAVHFEKGREPVHAIRYLTIAGTRARQRYANREALAYLDPALAAVARLPDEAARRRLELHVRLGRGAALSDLHGYASAAMAENYQRADELGDEVGSLAEQFEIVYALCHFHTARSHTGTVDAMAARLDVLASRVGTAETRLIADCALVRIALATGRFGDACARMQRSKLELTSSQRPDRPPAFGPDPIIDANTHYALALWFLGYPARARATMEASLRAARASGMSFTHAAAASLAATLAILRGKPDEALTLAEEAISMCSEQGFAFWYGQASAIKGYALVLRDQIPAGIERLTQARAALQTSGTVVFSSYILAFLTDAHRRAGNLAAALAAADDGLTLVESNLDRGYRSELWRLKGELLIHMSSVPERRGKRVDKPAMNNDQARHAEGEGCLVQALHVAREAEAKSLELRAAMSLARAWKYTGRGAEAVSMLADICAWFGTDTEEIDLIAARTLLDDLRAPRRRAPR